MKTIAKVAAIISIAAIAFGCGAGTEYTSAGTNSDTRFETVTEYESKHDIVSSIYFTVVRDKKTGVEYTCVQNRSSDRQLIVFVNEENKNKEEVK